MADESATFDDPLLRQRADRRRLVPTLTVAYHDDERFLGARRVIAGSLTLGRRSEAFGAGALDDGLLSRAHASVEPSDAGVGLRDLGSRNGTYVNGQRIESAELAEGDVVSLGAVAMVFGRGPLAHSLPRDPLLAGVSAALGALLAEIEAVACTPATVLVSGETGVGKELVARRLHEVSGRRGAFVAVNCGGIAEGVAPSELFGHARGAFSGAGTDRGGLVESAAGGTLLLDEIGDAPPSLQTSLLRLLESGEYRRVGGDELRHSDARFVAATHVDLAAAVAAGSFRQDLLARLARWVVAVPPLRHRREDVIPIALDVARRGGRRRVIERALALELLYCDWPDNVRGLAAVVDQAAIESPGDIIELTPRVRDRLAAMRPPSASPEPAVETYRKRRPDASYLRRRFLELDGNVKAFASELGVARNTLYRWFEEAAIDPASLRR